MLTHLFVVLFTLIDDFHHGRLWLCMLSAFGITALVYAIALPLVLPIWLGPAMVGTGGIIGLVWERKR